MRFGSGGICFEIETLKGRWQFSEVVLGFDGDDIVRLTIASPAIMHAGEIDMLIEDALDRCFHERQSLAYADATVFDPAQFLLNDLSAFGLHVMPSCEQTWRAVPPPEALQ